MIKKNSYFDPFSDSNQFPDLIEKIKLGDTTTKTIYTLAKTCVYSVINKVQSTGYTDAMRQIKASVYSSQIILSDEVSDDKAISDIVGDGWDLVQVAAAEILNQIRQHGTDLESTYTAERLSKHVWTSDFGTECKAEAYITCGIREVYKAVRRAIIDNRAVVTDPEQMSMYIESGQADDGKAVYRRMLKPVSDKKYVKDTTTFVQVETRSGADRVDTILAALRLTEPQRKVLRLRMQGYSERAIAQKLGITYNSVHGHMNRVREKAQKLCYVK